jgi:hydrogenase small subunit
MSTPINLSRRDFLLASGALLAARRLNACGARGLRAAAAAGTRPPVIWLQGQGCNGDSVSLLNSIHYMPVKTLLTDTIDLKYHPTVMAAAGDLAVSAANAARTAGGYVLAIEGAISTAAAGKYCTIWPGMTMLNAVQTFSQQAGFILAIGSCACFGGMTAGAPNPTGAKGVGAVLGADNRIINIPGCPAHPDWIVGTVAYLLANGQAPPLDANRRPTMFFGKCIHDYCFRREVKCDGERVKAPLLGQDGCLQDLGCKGPTTYSDCYMRQHNGGTPGRMGVNWCVAARSPCIGCVQPDFPDGMSPFFE